MKTFFSESLFKRKKKIIKERNDKLKIDIQKIIENNKNTEIEHSPLLNYYGKKLQKIDRNRYNNSFLYSNGLSKLDSTTKTSFSNNNNEKNLNSSEISFNKVENNKINFNSNNNIKLNETNLYLII